MKKTKQEYIEQIENATPLQLIIINYELLLAHINDATQKKARTKEAEAAIEKARKCVEELHASLSLEVEFSLDLANLYLYINKLLIHAGMKRDDDEKNRLLHEAAKIAGGLFDAWCKLEADVKLLEKAAANTPPIFAGLTYGKDGQLNEFEDEDPNRGYRA